MSQLAGSAALTEKSFVNGSVMRVAGFDVFERSVTTSFTSAGAKKALDAVDTVTDLGSAIAFHPSFVRYATGTKMNAGIQIFSNEKDPTYYSTINSAYTRVGASTSYEVDANNVVKGVVTLIESK